MNKDIFDNRAVKPMLIADNKAPFISNQHIYELKFDGIRCISYINSDTVDLRNKRNRTLLQTVPELADIFKSVKEKCILDGELFVLKNGKPDFFEIQSRVIMTDPFKIQLASKRYPASFLAFDILYYKNRLVIDLPLMERKTLLEKVVYQNERLAISKYFEGYGVQLFKIAQEQKLEGIVSKRKDSLYWLGKETKDWIKSKVLASADCVVCGYLRKKDHIALILGLYDGNKLLYKGHVPMYSMTLLNNFGYTESDASPFGYIPDGNSDAVWLHPRLVCIVEYMPSDKPGFRQAVFRGFRDDKSPIECQITSEADA